MKRFYPAFTVEKSSLFASTEFCCPRLIEGVLTAPLAFNKVIPLKGNHPEAFALDHDIVLETVHVYIPGHGVVAFDVESKTQIFGTQHGERQMTVMIRGNYEFQINENTRLCFSVFGVVSLRTSFADMLGTVYDYEGMKEAPELVGFVLRTYEARKVIAAPVVEITA